MCVDLVEGTSPSCHGFYIDAAFARRSPGVVHNMSKCSHARTREGQSHAFAGGVARPPYTDENRAAHGCVTYTEVCLQCGARRSVNQNQLHHEFGVWGPSLEIRRAEAASLAREAREAIGSLAPLVFQRQGRRATVRLDADGLISIDGAAWEEILPALSRSAWLDQAKAARRALAVAQTAQEDV